MKANPKYYGQAEFWVGVGRSTGPAADQALNIDTGARFHLDHAADCLLLGKCSFLQVHLSVLY